MPQFRSPPSPPEDAPLIGGFDQPLYRPPDGSSDSAPQPGGGAVAAMDDQPLYRPGGDGGGPGAALDESEAPGAAIRGVDDPRNAGAPAPAEAPAAAGIPWWAWAVLAVAAARALGCCPTCPQAPGALDAGEPACHLSTSTHPDAASAPCCLDFDLGRCP